MKERRLMKTGEYLEVIYSEERWELLSSLRARAREIMRALESYGLSCIVHGSVARGDVDKNSDIDIVVPYPAPIYLVELALRDSGFEIIKKELIQATPRHTPKLYFYLGDREVVSLPLRKLSMLERDFYRFGGELSLEDLEKDLRVPGIDKRLMIIIPTEKGHIEYSVIGREAEAARIVGVSIDIVKERIAILTRRREKGRTGVFMKVELPPDIPTEDALARIFKKKRKA